VCSVQTIQPNEIAFQRFMKSGPVALLPLWGTYSSIVWSLPEDLCSQVQELSDEAFVDALNKALRNPSDAPFLGRLPDKVLPREVKHRNFEAPPLVSAVNTKRYAFPLTLKISKQFASHRMALIGDASRRVHPLAG
jgi:2-polyprenyl-6-methoxyphenol hydroxylase-like FAD-dependent oxidoreductase